MSRREEVEYLTAAIRARQEYRPITRVGRAIKSLKDTVDKIVVVLMFLERVYEVIEESGKETSWQTSGSTSSSASGASSNCAN